MNIRYALAGVVAAGAIVLPAAAAHADVTCSVPGASCAAPSITPVTITTGGGFSPAVEGSTAVQVAPSSSVQTSPAPTSSLPFTGGDVAGLTAAGLGLLGAGTVLVRRNRVRTSEVRA
jgi:hypothetical protein